MLLPSGLVAEECHRECTIVVNRFRECRRRRRRANEQRGAVHIADQDRPAAGTGVGATDGVNGTGQGAFADIDGGNRFVTAPADLDHLRHAGLRQQDPARADFRPTNRRGIRRGGRGDDRASDSECDCSRTLMK